jgi:hypothetical protein
VSSHDRKNSAISKAGAINLLSDQHGVVARVFNQITAEAPIAHGAPLGKFQINGIEITELTDTKSIYLLRSLFTKSMVRITGDTLIGYHSLAYMLGYWVVKPFIRNVCLVALRRWAG